MKNLKIHLLIQKLVDKLHKYNPKRYPKVNFCNVFLDVEYSLLLLDNYIKQYCVEPDKFKINGEREKECKILRKK